MSEADSRPDESAGARFPEFTTPSDLAKRLGCSERLLRSMARQIGACRILSRTMLFTEDDIAALLEAARPESRVPARPRPHAAELPVGDYAALVVLRERQEREQKRKRAALRHR